MSQPLPPEVLEQLLLGKLPPEQVELYASQLEKSDWFTQIAAEIAPKDELLRLVREQKQSETVANDARIDTLITKLRSLSKTSSFPASREEGTMVQGSSPSISSIKDARFGFLSPPQGADELGRLNGYRVLKLLGEGGMGMVFLAEDVKLKRKLALKVMKPEIAAMETHRLRFLREAQTAASVEHDHIIPIFRVDEENGVPYIAMPFLKGEPLDERLKRVPQPSIQDVMRIGRQIAEGLSVAHEAGLIHRDIKPGNVWLEAPQDRVKILDFGLARTMTGELNLTQSGVMMGTPAYMAPEQARGSQVDGRADLFSLGVMLYQMATGTRPFVGNDLMSLLTSLAMDTPPTPQTISPQVPALLGQLIMQLLEKDANKRPQSAKEVADRLRQMEANPTLPVLSMPEIKPAQASNDPWQDIDDETEVVEAKPRVKSSSAKPRAVSPPVPPKNNKKLLYGGLGGLAVVLLGFIIIKITNKDGTETEIKVPEGAKIEIVQGDGETLKEKIKTKIAEGVKERIEGKLKAKDMVQDADRKAAEFCIRNGGFVTVNGTGYSDIDKLPKEPFKISELVSARVQGQTADADLELFRPLTELRMLAIRGPITNAGMANLGEFPAASEYQALAFEGSQITDDGLRVMPKFGKLRGVAISSPNFTGRGLVHLKGLQLGRIDLGGSGILDAELVHLKAFLALRWLGIGTPISDAGLKHIGELTALTHLQMQTTSNVTDAGIKHIENLQNLLLLEYAGPGNSKDQTSASLESIGKLKNLRNLSYYGILNTDADLKHLVGLVKLETLNFDPKSVTDEGLKSLAQLKSLKTLNLKGSKVTAEGVKKLHAALPGCKIESDHGTFEPGKPSPDDGFTPLFNGKDFTGWATFEGNTTGWKIKDGILISDGPMGGNLFTAKEYRDVHIRVETRINHNGNSGVFARAPFVKGLPSSYEAQISPLPKNIVTGGIYHRGGTGVKPVGEPPPGGEWFTMELIVVKDKVTVLVNGKQTAVFIDPQPLPAGRIALQKMDAASVVEFRKVELKDLSPITAAPAGKQYAFLVGVNRYENKKELEAAGDLKFADSDAVKVETTLLGLGVPDKQILTLTTTAQPKSGNYYPSAANVRRHFEEFTAKLTENDSLLVSFSGYELQFTNKQDYALSTADLHPTDKTKQLMFTELYAILEKSKCKRVVFLVDSCRLGETTKQALAPGDPPKGISVIFACSGGQNAYEHAELGGGVLTQYFVKGLRGEADANGDKEVTWKELFEFMKKEVPQFAKKELKVDQLPSLFGELPEGGFKAK